MVFPVPLCIPLHVWKLIPLFLLVPLNISWNANTFYICKTIKTFKFNYESLKVLTKNHPNPIIDIHGRKLFAIQTAYAKYTVKRTPTVVVVVIYRCSFSYREPTQFGSLSLESSYKTTFSTIQMMILLL